MPLCHLLFRLKLRIFFSIEVAVDYPWKPKFCTICKMPGHEDRYCRNTKEIWRPVSMSSKHTTSSSIQVDAYPVQVDGDDVQADPSIVSPRSAQNEKGNSFVDPLGTSKSNGKDCHVPTESSLNNCPSAALSVTEGSVPWSHRGKAQKCPSTAIRKPLNPLNSNVYPAQKSNRDHVCSFNSFSVLDEESKDIDKESALLKRYRKPFLRWL